MDKQLLDALNNLSNSLDMIAETLAKKGQSNTTTTNALVSGDFSKQLVEINTSLKSIKKDTTDILSKQNTILEMQRRNNSDGTIFDSTGEDPKKENLVKKGVSTILLIAGAVLAIGLAFKIIGTVDFVSVVGLGLALVLISQAFVKIAESKVSVENAILTGKAMVIMSMAVMLSSWVLAFLRPISLSQSISAILIAGMFTVISFGIKNMIVALGTDIGTLGKSIALLPLLLPAIALGLTLSSWALSYIEPISFSQAITAILIAGMFTVISFGIKKLINSLGADIGTLAKSIALLPLLLPAIALGIAASSWVLKSITPITFAQAGTAILIGAMFTVLSFGMNKMFSAFKDLNPAIAITVSLLMPLVLVAMSIAIAKSSEYLSQVKGIGFSQFITALGVSLIFVVFAYALKAMSPIINKLDFEDVVKIPLIFTTLAIAVMIASNILVDTADISFEKMLKILAFSVVFAVSVTVLGLASYVLAQVGVEKMEQGALGMILLSGAIMVSSLLLGLGSYEKYPGVEWALGVGLSLLAFGVAAVELGTVIMTGIGATALAAGAVGILGVAVTIVAASHILAQGKYEKYPGLGWAMGVGLSMTGFGLSMMVLGTAITASLGLGMVALIAGNNAVLMIAQTIVDTSFILAKGKYEGGPTMAWSGGIALAMAAFSPLYAMLMANGIMKIFGGGIGPDDFAKAIKTVSRGIVDAANYFAGAKVAFKGGPTKEWAEGVGTAIAAFSPVYAALMQNNFWSSNVSPDDMKNGILTIADGIITAAYKFSENKAVFDVSRVPSVEWGQNVGAALQAFAPLFKYMSEQSGWFTSGEEAANELSSGILSVASTIIIVAKKLAAVNPNVWMSYPSRIWISGVTGGIKGFVAIASGLEDLTYAGIMKVSRVTNSMISVARSLWRNSDYFSKNIDPNYMSNLSKNVIGYADLAKRLNTLDVTNPFKSMFGLDPISQAARGMIKIAGAYDKLAIALKKFGTSLESIDETKVNLIRRLTGNLAVLAAMNQDSFTNMMETLEKKASIFSKLVEVDTERSKPVNVGDFKPQSSVATVNRPKSKHDETHQQLDTIIDLLSQINQSTGGLDEFIESRGKDASLR